MGWIELILLSISLAMDCFAISCVVGMVQPNLEKRYIWRFALAFGIFQGGMPLVGWLFGESLLGPLGKIAPFIAFGILAFIGGKMLVESFRKEEENPQHLDVTKWKNVVLLAIATSIDALAVGISFACTGYDRLSQLPLPLTIIGLASFVLSLVGYALGRRFGKVITRRLKPELFGGIILILIGLKILLEHLGILIL